MTAGAEFDAWIAINIAPTLFAHGFVGGARRYCRPAPGYLALVEFQASRTAPSTETQFTVNIGVWSERLAPGDARRRRCPSAMDGHLAFRLAELSSFGRERWWKLRKGFDDRTVAAEVRRLLVDYGLPFLERCSEDEGFVHEISKYRGTYREHVLRAYGLLPDSTEGARGNDFEVEAFEALERLVLHARPHSMIVRDEPAALTLAAQGTPGEAEAALRSMPPSEPNYPLIAAAALVALRSVDADQLIARLELLLTPAPQPAATAYLLAERVLAEVKARRAT